jgi:hypothetical protein
LAAAPKCQPRRALRFRFLYVDEFRYFHLHEDEEGRQLLMNDAFGTPFEGVLDWGWSRRLELRTATHELALVPGTRSVSGGTLRVEDIDGGIWHFAFQVTAPPYVIVPVGYHLGSWRDGGNIHTYHGPDDPYLEWDELTRQPRACAGGDAAPGVRRRVLRWVDVTDARAPRAAAYRCSEPARAMVEAPGTTGRSLMRHL